MRVEHNDDDDLIGALAAGSRIHVEAQTRRALVTQSWRIALDCWPEDGRARVIPAPLQELTAARVYDVDGNAHAVETQAFVPDLGASTLAFAPWALPQPGRIAAGIELDVTVGYSDAAVDVPEPLRQAIRLLIGHWYENRGLAALGTVKTWSVFGAGWGRRVAEVRSVSLAMANGALSPDLQPSSAGGRAVVPVAKTAQQGSAGAVVAAGIAAANQAHSSGGGPAAIAALLVLTLVAAGGGWLFWHWRQRQQQEKPA